MFTTARTGSTGAAEVAAPTTGVGGAVLGGLLRGPSGACSGAVLGTRDGACAVKLPPTPCASGVGVGSPTAVAWAALVGAACGVVEGVVGSSWMTAG